MLLKPARDAKGQLVGSSAVGKYGTPKCEFSLQLLRCAEPENEHLSEGGCWVGAHPSIGEKAAHALLSRGILEEELEPTIPSLWKEAPYPSGHTSVAEGTNRLSKSFFDGFQMFRSRKF